MSPKTWRIFTFAYAIWFLLAMLFTTDKPRSSAFDCVFHPPGFSITIFLFRAKNIFSYFACFTKSRKKCLSDPLVDATICYKRTVFSSGKMYFLKTFQMAKKFVRMKFAFTLYYKLNCQSLPDFVLNSSCLLCS